LVVLVVVPITHLTLLPVAVAVVEVTSVVVAVVLTLKPQALTVAVAVVDLASLTQPDSSQLYTPQLGNRVMVQPALHTT
jgi:hypothetical protein